VSKLPGLEEWQGRVCDKAVFRRVITNKARLGERSRKPLKPKKQKNKFDERGKGGLKGIFPHGDHALRKVTLEEEIAGKQTEGASYTRQPLELLFFPLQLIRIRGRRMQKKAGEKGSNKIWLS